MNETTNEDGVVCARVNNFPQDGEAWAIAVSWKEGVDGLPDARAWNEAIDSNLAQCKEKGAGHHRQPRGHGDRRRRRSARGPRRDAPRFPDHPRPGFKQGEGRVEYRMGLDEALAALEAGKITAGLTWSCVDTGTEAELARAAALLRQAAEGDPASHPDDDALGFLKALLEDEDAAGAPERVQIGLCEGVPAAVLALNVYPGNGWSSIYYLGVLPAFRGRGFGAEAMLHAFRCLKSMGGRTYHDGTDRGTRQPAPFRAPRPATFPRYGRMETGK